MRSIEEINKDIVAVKQAVREEVIAHNYKEVELLYVEFDTLEDEMFWARRALNP